MSAHGNYARYACDACRTRKVSCTRELPKCARCRAQGGTTCCYSRFGVVRRNRKRGTATPAHASSEGTPSRRAISPSPPAQGTLTERLERLVGRQHSSLRDLATLVGEYHSVWQDGSALDTLAEGVQTQFHQFSDDEKRVWADDMVAFLSREKIMNKDSIPQDVLNEIEMPQLGLKGERAWGVMFYSVALRDSIVVGSPTDNMTILNLKSNLWLAFNDARFLIEPSTLSIQALIAMTLCLKQYLSPNACWSLVSKACTMLLGLGFGTHAHIDSATKKLRDALFWRLNPMDKALSLILGRTPIFQRDLTKGTSPPSLEGLLSTHPRYPADGMPVLFEAHYEQQMALLSHIQVDVWHCLPRHETQDVLRVRKDLETWYTKAKKVLEASALVEKCLLSNRGHALMELHLQTLQFNFYYLDILLAIASRDLRSQCTTPAQKLLSLLPRLGDLLQGEVGREAGLLWEWIHYPMVAFGTLWGQVVSKGVGDREESERILKVLGNVPRFLETLQSRNAMAAKLKDITEKIIHHVCVIYRSSWVQQQVATADMENAPEVPSDPSQPDLQFDMPTASAETTFDAPLDGLLSLPDEFLFDPTFDWFSWGDQLL